MGKTKEAEAAQSALRAAGRMVDLVDAGRRADPRTTLLGLVAGPHGQRWLAGEDWHIFVDGIDEAVGAAPAFLDAFAAFLAQLADSGGDLGTLRLRLLCRTVDWPAALDNLIAGLWPDKDVGHYQIGPLREDDVREGMDRLTGSEQDAERFVEEVRQRHLQPLAGRPVSFRMLSLMFTEGSGLPVGQAELYLRGLQALILEHDTRRKPRFGVAPLDVDAQLLIAGRIAAATILSGRPQISIETDGDEAPDNAVSHLDISGGTEPDISESFQVRASDVIDVLGSPLFAAVGPGRYVWAHQTFPEYLTARYFISHKLSAEASLEILSVGLPSGARAICPQLREVAAWLASIDPRAFALLIDSEPDILLQSDVAGAAAADRARLVDALLRRLEIEEFIAPFMAFGSNLAKLAHPDLAHQLEGVIRDRERGVFVRRSAIDIAEATELTSLGPILTIIALDATEPLVLRKDAAFGVFRLGDQTAQRALVPLLTSDLSADVSDELRGAVLLSTWKSLTVGQLLAAITPPKNEHLIGSYSLALHQIAFSPFSEEDALDAIRWLSPFLTRIDDVEPDRALRDLAPKVFWRVLERTDASAVREALAPLFQTGFDNLSQWVLDESDDRPARWPATQENRLDLLTKVLLDQANPRVLARNLVWVTPSLVEKDDLRALTTLLLETPDPATKSGLREIIVSLVHSQNLDGLSFVWDVAALEPELAAALEAAFYVSFGSDTERWMKDSRARQQKLEARRAETSAGAATADETVRRLLSEIEDGAPNQWWVLNLQLFVGDDGRYQASNEHLGDLRESPGWKRADEALRNRIRSAAATSLRADFFESYRWIGKNSIYRPASGAYRALRLLHDDDPEGFASLDPEVLGRWASAVLVFFDNAYSSSQTAHQNIVAAVRLAAPDAFDRALARLALGPQSEGIGSRTLEILESVYDAPLGDFLVRLLSRPSFKGPRSRTETIALLLRQHHPWALGLFDRALDRFASGPIKDSGLQTLDEVALATGVAHMLGTDPSAVWPRLHAARTTNPEFAKQVWTVVAENHDLRGAEDFLNLSEPDLASAYLDLEALFPGRPARSGAHFLSAIDFVDRIRQSIINRIVTAGTEAGLAAFQRISDNAPAADLAWRREELRRNYRSRARRLYEPDEIVRLVSQIGAPPPPLRDEVAAALQDIKVVAGEEGVFAVPIEAIFTPEPSPSPASSPPLYPKRIVAMATEWSSAHGGISTLNRELCSALADLGHQVQCVVLRATDAELASAAASGVTLIVSPERTQILDRDRLLLLRSHHFGPEAPEVVIGHDHITGPQAASLAEDLGVPYVHMLHTVPDVAEFHKTKGGGANLLRGAYKQSDQNALAAKAALVVAVGPRIRDNAITNLGDAAPVYMMVPGLNPVLIKRPQAKPALQLRCLLAGRMEDALLKGAKLGCQAVKKVATEYDWAGSDPKLTLRGFDNIKAEEEFAPIGKLADYAAHLRLEPYTDVEADIHNDLRTASVVLMPSKVEGFGLAAFEAIAAGVPVIMALDSGIGRYLIEAHKAGLIDAETVQTYLADVAGEDQTIVASWSTKIHHLLADRDGAFARAEALRVALAKELTWNSAARLLTLRLEEALDT